MGILIGFLTLVLVLTCMLLILLVLIQLPKKEAGIGQAFGGGATDALFGAGSGNALTKLTKYATTVFLSLSLVLSGLNAHKAKSTTRDLNEELKKRAGAGAVVTPAPAAVNATPAPANANALKMTVPTNAPVTSAPVTPAPATTPATTPAPVEKK